MVDCTRAQVAEAVEEAFGGVLELRDRARQHRIGRSAAGQRAEHRLAQQQDLGKQIRTRLVDVAMDQVLQPAGLAFQQRQDLVGLAHLPDVVPGRSAAPGRRSRSGCQHQHHRGIQRRDRQDAPADRDRAQQPDDAACPDRRASWPSCSLAGPRCLQDPVTPPHQCGNRCGPGRSAHSVDHQWSGAEATWSTHSRSIRCRPMPVVRRRSYRPRGLYRQSGTRAQVRLSRRRSTAARQRTNPRERRARYTDKPDPLRMRSAVDPKRFKHFAAEADMGYCAELAMLVNGISIS